MAGSPSTQLGEEQTNAPSGGVGLSAVSTEATVQMLETPPRHEEGGEASPSSNPSLPGPSGGFALVDRLLLGLAPQNVVGGFLRACRGNHHCPVIGLENVSPVLDVGSRAFEELLPPGR